MKKTAPKITPRGKQVLVIPDNKLVEKTETGIYLPDNVEKEQKAIGTVQAVGPEVKDLKKGQRVLYAMYGGENIRFKDSPKDRAADLVLLYDEDVLALIEGDL